MMRICTVSRFRQGFARRGAVGGGMSNSGMPPARRHTLDGVTVTSPVFETVIV